MMANVHLRVRSMVADVRSDDPGVNGYAYLVCKRLKPADKPHAEKCLAGS